MSFLGDVDFDVPLQADTSDDGQLQARSAVALLLITRKMNSLLMMAS